MDFLAFYRSNGGLTAVTLSGASADRVSATDVARPICHLSTPLKTRTVSRIALVVSFKAVTTVTTPASACDNFSHVPNEGHERSRKKAVHDPRAAPFVPVLVSRPKELR